LILNEQCAYIIKKNLDCKTDPRDVHSGALTALVIAMALL